MIENEFQKKMKKVVSSLNNSGFDVKAKEFRQYGSGNSILRIVSKIGSCSQLRIVRKRIVRKI